MLCSSAVPAVFVLPNGLADRYSLHRSQLGRKNIAPLIVVVHKITLNNQNAVTFFIFYYIYRKTDPSLIYPLQLILFFLNFLNSELSIFAFEVFVGSILRVLLFQFEQQSLEEIINPPFWGKDITKKPLV